MNAYPIVIENTALEWLSSFLSERKFSKILLISDQHTRKHCYPILESFLPPHEIYEIAPGEIYKNLDTCQLLWEALTHRKMDRQSVVINLGGGVIGDMGGFVAATYKRGISFIQVPTTLLSMVDASVGGKLGIDFKGFKNHIGIFCEPEAVVIYPPFLDTLPEEELASGFAEVIKHHLIADRERWGTLKQVKDIRNQNLAKIIRHSVDVKQKIVEIDPFEKGIRKALNFGHTVGHAIEGHALEQGEPMLHGEAVAIGMIAESWISMQRGLLAEAELGEIKELIGRLYPGRQIMEVDFEVLYARAQNDKKNIGGEVICSLLEGIGKPLVNVAISKEEFMGALTFANIVYGF
ncbi:MAG: 3-dehydroquinate synthase [Bacteroidia bacterium]|nr:3-dehydroquinate synthase [Bacteroidia bacterium]